MDKYQRWYKQIEEIINWDLAEFLIGKVDYIKIKSSGFIDFNIDRLSNKRIALSHYYEHESGDMIADPYIVIGIDIEKKIAYPISYKDSFSHESAYELDDEGKIVGIYPEVQKELEEFFDFWIKNLKKQRSRAS